MRIRRQISDKIVRRFKFFLFTVTFFGIINLVVSAVDTSRWSSYSSTYTYIFGRGQIVEYADDEDFCQSWVLIPGASLVNKGWLIVAYLFALFYLFLGLSIAADKLMSGLEVIISYSKTVTYEDEDGVTRSTNVSIWNPTLANLTMMALGSSIPEIIMYTIETISDLGSTPGQIGASTIVGSAAFNLFIIVSVCIISVDKDQTKKIQDVYVFGFTAIVSVLGYIWLYIVLEGWSPGKIYLAEAILTFLFFPLFVILAFIVDKISKKIRTPDESHNYALIRKKSIPIKDFNQIVDPNKSKKEVSDNFKRLVKKQMNVNMFLRDNFGTNNVSAKNLEEMKYNLVSQDPIQQKIFIKKLIGDSITGKLTTETKKNNLYYNELKQIQNNKSSFMNPLVGFKCLHYSISEKTGKINVKIINKTRRAIEIGVRTIESTATADEDYKSLDKKVKFEDGQVEAIVSVEIYKDDIKYEPDEDFFVEIYDPENKKRLEGADTKAKVTIVDSEDPGKVGFKHKITNVQANERAALIPVIRKHGSTGVISVKFKTEESEEGSKLILDGVEFTPISGTVTFEDGETSKHIIIPVLDFYRISKVSVVLFEPTGGSKLSRKSTTQISIVGEDSESIKAKGIEEIIKQMQKEQHLSWLQQFKHACILSPKIDENGMIDDINEFEAAIHYASIGWKVLFATIPPSRYLKGWPCLLVSFIYIGCITALVLEFAGLLGCVMKFKQALIGIGLVAIGTSLPDVFASRHAAIKSDDADIAIGGITGSICINAFLGFGLPWLIGSIYYTSKGQDFDIPRQELSFTILIYMLTSFCCLATLFVRRFVFGGEIGGKSVTWRYLTVGWFVFLWAIYLLFSVLRSYGVL